MTGVRVFIAGMGLITPVGKGVGRNWTALKKGESGIGKLTLFPTAKDLSFPVGEVSGLFSPEGPPRTHKLAFLAAKEAMAGSSGPPHAIIMGSTTGGMNRTEKLLKKKQLNPSLFSYHGAGAVAEYLALEFNCKGPVITVSTACSSGAAAIKIAVALLKSGRAERVLVGGAESLCRLTYFGFHSLQLIDPEGARPLDRDRRGLTVSEGAGMLLLEGTRIPPDSRAIEILGAGLSCDAYHPASPDPEGQGALAAMKGALSDAGMIPSDIDYVNLHGTGTMDNDLSEAKAFHRLFDQKKPLVSSVKGTFGHSLSAAGAIEAVISAKCVASGLVPAGVGCHTPDPRLKLNPVRVSTRIPVKTVLSNSFGFGGSNASVIIGRSKAGHVPSSSGRSLCLEVLGSACITGAGCLSQTLKAFSKGKSCEGLLSEKEMVGSLSPKTIRRLKRLSRMGLSLAVAACADAGNGKNPGSVFLGTGWGALSETHDFLSRLYETDERFSSPTDFIGSVHNAAAGRIAVRFNARGPNITTTGGDYSFEQALMAAHLLAKEGRKTFLAMGVDEFHSVLSPLFDPSVARTEIPSDGGGALLLRSGKTCSGPKVAPLFYENANNNPYVVASLEKGLGGASSINRRFGAVFAGLPAGFHEKGRQQLRSFIKKTGFQGPVIDYRRFLGQFASASAVAAVLGVELLKIKEIPFALSGKEAFRLNEKGILLLGLGSFVTAVGVRPPEESP